MEYSLTDTDIMHLMGNRAKILTYKDIYNYSNIDSLLKPYDVVIILFETVPDKGHWTILFKRNKKQIEFFDSYGFIVDVELDYVDKKYKNQLKENYRYLTRLIYESPYELEYNPYKFQKMKKDINTCGRWCVLRYEYKKLTIDQFYKLINSVKIDKDILVTLLVTI
jgi:hypothetical protein